jgi:hypothetical protein
MNEIQVQVTKGDEALSKKMEVIGNQVQTLTGKLLTPFSAHNINMEEFFKDVAENLSQREKNIEDRKQMA